MPCSHGGPLTWGPLPLPNLSVPFQAMLAFGECHLFASQLWKGPCWNLAMFASADLEQC